jgi:predicted ATPase
MSIFVVVKLTALEAISATKRATWSRAIEAFHAIVKGRIELYGGQVFLLAEEQITARFNSDAPEQCATAVQYALEVYRQLGEQEWFLNQSWQKRIAIHATGQTTHKLHSAGQADDEAAFRLAHALLDAVPGPSILITPEAAAVSLLPPAATLQDLGVHLLPQVNQLHKVLALSPDIPASANYYLVTPLVARATELAQIGQWLTNPACRLLTIVGPGGAGKTHLALHAATRLSSTFAQGVYFVPLVVLSSTERLVPLIAATLNVSLAGSTGYLEPKVRLTDYLRGKEVLLIIDNLEHLVAGAALLHELMAAAPRLKILATSRERLNLAGEWSLEISGLSFPPANVAADIDIEAYGAVQLFVSRARQNYQAFTLSEHNRLHVAQICRLVQGLPLAIELAAAWVGSLTCQEIAYQIESNVDFLATSRLSLPERQRSLQAVFDYSWNLLNDAERSLYGKLAAFRGGFSREAAEQVAGASLLLLARLGDKSLLRRVPSDGDRAASRYEILGVLHTYAERALRARPEEAKTVYEQHCAYYADFLHRRERDLYGKRQKQALDAIALEIENIRAGWRWAVEHGRLTYLDRALRALHLFYDIKGYYKEGQQLMEEAVRAVQPVAAAGGENGDAAPPHLLLCRLYARLADFSSCLGKSELARMQIEESLAIARRYGADIDEAYALNTSGYLSQNSGNYEEARDFLQSSLHIYQRLDNQEGMARVLNNLGIVSRMLGDYNATSYFYQSSLDLYRRLGDQQGVARALLNRAVVIKLGGDYQAARQACQESLALFRAAGNQRGIVASLNNLGSLAEEMGAYHESWDYHQKSLVIRREMGDGQGIALALVNLGEVADSLGRHDEAKEYFRNGVKLALKTNAIPRALIGLTGMAAILRREGHLQEAIETVAFILAQPELIQVNREKAKQLLSELQSVLPAEEVVRFSEQGRQRSLNTTVERALHLL